MREYIEREALLDEINIAPVSMSICMNVDECKGRIYERERLVRIINEATAADVVPVRHGRWIEREDMYYGWNIWECSVCREEFCVEEGTPKDNEYNYCPNCGARMDGDGDV